jgi:hypothetical protein
VEGGRNWWTGKNFLHVLSLSDFLLAPIEQDIMGFLRGPGSLRFKWGMTKALFPELTKTYYKNTGRSSVGKQRATSNKGGVRLRYEFAPPSAKELDWIRSFALFQGKADAFMASNNPAARDELSLLVWAGHGFVLKNESLFHGTSHSKAFVDAYTAFLDKIREAIRFLGDHKGKPGEIRVVWSTWEIKRL